MIQAVLFDLDQTLLDRTSSLEKFLEWQINTLTLVPLSQQQNFIQRFITLDANGTVWKDKVYAQLIQEFQISKITVQALLTSYIEDFNKFCVAFQSVDSVLDRLVKADFSLGLISNGRSPFQERNFQALGVDKLFSSIIVSEAVGLRKPDPKIFQLACRQLELMPEQCIFVGDNEVVDIVGAKSVGMQAILFDPEQKVIST
ncbi:MULTISPECIES: HAD family hydrolase [unclassified Acinetobacter]|uniref:HAD family hydrolase n=1 Tax=unclassified Acinetobacter TaxID=196816 RepID=UPI0018AB4208|nr:MULTISPECIES: HAD family hydrolase [unclassified Acinetobacter]MBJ9954820.1 HAD family hydrolase [Acinetobacter baumannii]